MASPKKKAFLMRIDPDLWTELERRAAAELRSVNGQVEYLLREALNKGKATARPAIKRQQGIRMKRNAAGESGI